MSLILATPDQQTGHNTALNVERNIVNEAEKSQELKYTACLLELGRGARWRAAPAGEELGSTRAALAGREGIWCQQQQQLKEREAAAWSCSGNLASVSQLSKNVQLSQRWATALYTDSLEVGDVHCTGTGWSISFKLSDLRSEKDFLIFLRLGALFISDHI